MPLFDSDDLKKPSSAKASHDSMSSAVNVFFWTQQQKKLGVALDGFDFNDHDAITFISDGAWNMHDLLFYLLKRFGSGKVYFTTWAISEIAMRQLYLYLKDGLITELYGLFDYRNTSRKPAELAFIQQNATKIKLAKCHAKVTVIEMPSMSISIVTSANYTRNPRLEAGNIFVCRDVAEFHKQWILKEIYTDGPN